MPTRPKDVSDVRFAAGNTRDFINPASHERTPGYRVLYSIDEEAGVWVGLCVDRGVYLEGESGESLGEIHSRFCDRILELKRSAVIDGFGPADPDSSSLWEEIRGVGAFASNYGDPDEILMQVKAGARADDDSTHAAAASASEQIYAATMELALAA